MAQEVTTAGLKVLSNVTPGTKVDHKGTPLYTGPQVSPERIPLYRESDLGRYGTAHPKELVRVGEKTLWNHE